MRFACCFGFFKVDFFNVRSFLIRMNGFLQTNALSLSTKWKFLSKSDAFFQRRDVFFFFKKQFDIEDTRVSPWVSLIFKPCAVAFKQMSMYGVRQLRLKDSNGVDVSVEGLPPKPGAKSLTPRK